MKKLYLIAAMFCLSSVSAQGQTFYGTSDVAAFREAREREFQNKDESPLEAEGFANFKALDYFPVEETLRLSAVFKRSSGEHYFLMPTSSGKARKFIKYGVLNFELAAKGFALNVYQADSFILEQFPEYADLLFIPFKDLTNGAETYGGGRYIDIKTPSGDQVILDFNLAYNPNCAYGSDRYNCPIPPRENSLKTEIRAGERSYRKAIADEAPKANTN